MSYEISVVIPVYNQEEYLNECLDSLVNQTIGVNNIEVILVNDKSTDNSLTILKEYIGKYPSFKLINHKENKGCGAARNSGLKEVTSDYLMFLDPDDYIDEHIIENSLNHIKENRCDLLIFNWESFPGVRDSIHNPNITQNNIINSLEERPALICSLAACGRVFSKKLYPHIKFAERYYDDLNVGVETLLNSDKIFLSKDLGYYYRNNQNSITHDMDIKNPLNLIESVDDLSKLLEKYPNDNKYIKLFIIKFIDLIFYIIYNFNWNYEDEIKIINSLRKVDVEISQEDIDYFNEIFPLRLMFGDDILYLKKYPAELFLATFNYFNQIKFNSFAKLYIDTGNGFNENESIKIHYDLGSDNSLKFDLSSFEDIVALRFDPISDEFSKVYLRGIESDSDDFNVVHANSINTFDDECQVFDNLDPHYIIEGDFSSASFVNFDFKIDILTKEELAKLFKRFDILPLAKLYVDVGHGFNEQDVISAEYKIERKNFLEFDLSSFEDIVALRFDPISDEFSKVCLLNIESDSNDFNVTNANCDNSLCDECQVFDNLDPHYIIEGDFSSASFISFDFNINILNSKELDNLFNKKDNIIKENKEQSKNSIFKF